MSEEPKKKKIMIKRKGSAKSAIRLNKPADEQAEETAEQQAPDVDAAGRKKIPLKPKAASTPSPATEADIADDTAAPKPEAAKEATQYAAPISDTVKQDEVVAKQEEVFKFYCVYCGQKLSASVAMVGKTITCPACKRRIEIPVPPS